MKASGVIAAVVLGLIVRVFAGQVLPYLNVDSPADTDNLSAIIQYAVMFGLGAIVARQARVSTRTVFGKRINPEHLVIGTWFAILLLMLTCGINALATWIVAQFRLEFAYRFWHFHEATYYVSLPATSFCFLIVAQFICAPIVEEFLFRGLLFRAWLRFGALNALIGVATLFTLLHYERHYWITTFVFSCILSILYLKYNSLWVNIVAHTANNIIAFTVQYYFDFHWTRPITHLSQIKYWIPEMGMLVISVPMLVLFMVRTSSLFTHLASQPFLQPSLDARERT